MYVAYMCNGLSIVYGMYVCMVCMYVGVCMYKGYVGKDCMYVGYVCRVCRACFSQLWQIFLTLFLVKSGDFSCWLGYVCECVGVRRGT